MAAFIRYFSALKFKSNARFMSIVLTRGLKFGSTHRYLEHFQLITKSHPSMCRLQCTCAAETNTNYRRHPRSSEIDEAIYYLDRIVRFHSRISLDEVMQVIQHVKALGTVDGRQSLYLLRTFGHFIPESHPDRRTEQLLQFWDDLHQLGVKFNIHHYNALLSNHLDNGYKFSVTEILSQLKENNITANNVTFLRLIRRFCEDGDISSATQIMNHMQDQELPINESVYCSLIHGHFVNGDITQALGTLETMQSEGVMPGIRTYAELMEGYARRGDVDEVLNIYTSEQMPLFTVLDAVYSLTMNGHQQHVPQLLDCIETIPFSKDHMSCSMRLIAQGHDDIAYSVILSAPKLTSFEGDEMRLGRFFVRAMIHNQRPIEKICKIVENLRDSGFIIDELDTVVRLAYLDKQPDMAMEMMDQLLNRNVTIRSHYFWPALRFYSMSQDRLKFDETVEKMQRYPAEATDGILSVRDFVLPGLLEMGDDLESAIDTITHKYQLVDKSSNFAILNHIFYKKGLHAAVDFAEGKELPISATALLETALLEDYLNTRDYRYVVKVAKTMVQSIRNKVHCAAFNSNILHKICTNESEMARVSKLIQAMRNEGLIILTSTPSSIQEYFSANGQKLRPQDLQALSEMSNPDSTPVDPTVSRTILSNSSLEEVEAMARRRPNKTILKWLLEVYCVNGYMHQADDVCRKLENMGFIYPDSVLAKLAYMEACYRRDFQAAKEYLHKLQLLYPDYGNYMRAMLNTASLQIENGDIEDAIDMINNYIHDHPHELSRTYKPGTTRLRNITTDCQRIVHAALTKTSPETTFRILQLLQHNFVSLSETALYDEFLHLATKQCENRVMVTCLECVVKVGVALPASVDDLLHVLIRSNDASNLQRAIDVLSEGGDGTFVLNQLILAFIDCRQANKARKIVEETADLTAVNELILKRANAFLRARKEEELNDLVDITTKMVGVDKDGLVLLLAQLYVSQKKFDQAADVVKLYERDGEEPAMSLAHYLIDHLPHPKLPSVIRGMSHKMAMMERERRICDGVLDLVTHRQVSQAFNLINKCDVPFHSIINPLLKSLHHISRSGFINVLNELGRRGDIVTLLSIHMDDPSEYSTKAVQTIKRAIFNAYIVSGQTEVLLHLLQDAPHQVASALPFDAFVTLSTNAPQHIPAFISLAEECYTTAQDCSPLNSLWSYFIINNEDDKAQDLLQTRPGLMKRLKVNHVCGTLMKSLQIERMLSLAKTLSFHVSGPALFIYNYLAIHHCRKDDPDAAIKLIEEMKLQADFDVSRLTDYSIGQLETLLSAHHRPIPWVPSKRLDRSIDRSSDDTSSWESDSSDSDDEIEHV